jgi:hypothetical protein
MQDEGVEASRLPSGPKAPSPPVKETYTAH